MTEISVFSPGGVARLSADGMGGDCAMNVSWALQTGIYEILSQDSRVTGLLGGPRIYDATPHTARFPYVTFGQMIEYDWIAGGGGGREHILTLHVWSRSGGRKEAMDIINAMNAALIDGPLTLRDHQLIDLRFQFAEVRCDPDGKTLHGIARYKGVTESLNRIRLASGISTPD